MMDTVLPIEIQKEKNMILNQLDRYRDPGLLILRIGIGLMFMIHGFPKLMGGPEAWTRLGGATAAIGVDLAPTFMGFMAAFAEFGGGLLLALGLLTRPACLLLCFTMIVATMMHVQNGDGFNRYSHALEASILFFSLFLIGPGRLSLDGIWSNRNSPEVDPSYTTSADS